MSFQKGHGPWNKGMKYKDISWMNLNGLKLGRGFLKGKKMLEETKRKISIKKKLNGDKPPQEFLTGKHIVGEKHWNWKGGITAQNMLDRIKFSKTIGRMVLKRDNYTCGLCGSRKELQVDHIQPWAEYIEGRFDMNNCRTLCIKCHYKITFGKPMPEGIKNWGISSQKGLPC